MVDTGPRGATHWGHILGASPESHPADEAKTGYHFPTLTPAAHLISSICAAPPSFRLLWPHLYLSHLNHLSSPCTLLAIPTCVHTPSIKASLALKSDIPIPPTAFTTHLVGPCQPHSIPPLSNHPSLAWLLTHLIPTPSFLQPTDIRMSFSQAFAQMPPSQHSGLSSNEMPKMT